MRHGHTLRKMTNSLLAHEEVTTTLPKAQAS